jgi:hypothetical protein
MSNLLKALEQVFGGVHVGHERGPSHCSGWRGSRPYCRPSRVRR